MASKEDLKRAACAEIERARGELFEFGDDVFAHAELGFKEVETARKVAERFRDLGLESREGLALTGVKAIASGGRPGPRIGVLGELDGLIVPDHPHAVAGTGAAHACGHNGQLVSMLGAALGLIRSGALGELAGSLALMAVPAEEYVEIEYRMALREQGKLEFLSGKQELIKLGEFDDVDMALMVHGTSEEATLFGASTGQNGLLAKHVRFIGRAAHAGSAPQRGVNALNAATLALNAIQFQRETFRDEDAIRVHGIITRGGDVVNIVPSDVRMELFVRGKTLEGYVDAARKVDRALRAGGYAVGAEVEITTLPGYAPMANNRRLEEMFKANAIELVGTNGWTSFGHRGGSTDMGDLGLIMPIVHPFAGGARGNLHGADFSIVDRDAFYLNPARAIAMTLVDLLVDEAAAAREVLAHDSPTFTKDAYLDFMRGLARVERYEA
jgi:amidohydrolase